MTSLLYYLISSAKTTQKERHR